MNRRMIVSMLGILLLLEAGLMLLPVLVGLIYRETSGVYFALTALLAVVLGVGMRLLARPRTKAIYARDGLLIVSLGWVLLSLVGALPFTVSGQIPSYLDAVFEMVSGFTTTGSSILTEVESLDNCMLFWRSFSHWIGGMGILVFMLSILRMEGGQAIHLLRAESPGPSVSKIVPHMTDSSKILYIIYLALTLLQVVFYLAGGMPVFDSFCNAFATAGTGGFAIKNTSFGAYSTYCQTVTTVFMALFGVNFSIYFLILQKKFRLAAKNSELRWYVGIILTAILLITLNIRSQYDTTYDALHHAAFSVSSVITTTGFCTANFDLWPEFSRVILVFLMAVGACAGSTGGGMKVSRFVLLLHIARADIRKVLHPRTVKVVSVDGKPVDKETIRTVSSYLILYVLILVVSLLLVSLDGFDGSTTVTAVMATFNNIGPGLSLVGPVGNFSIFSPLSKVVLCLDMLLGRLEIYPVLVMLLPSTWLKN